MTIFRKSLQEEKSFTQTIKCLGANPRKIILNSAKYPRIADKGKFFTEEFQVINAEVMMELEYHHFVTPNKITDLGKITNGCYNLGKRLKKI